jgi:hypothetical protein
MGWVHSALSLNQPADSCRRLALLVSLVSLVSLGVQSLAGTSVYASWWMKALS